MPLNPRLVVAWLAFLAAGTFFALMNPLGEGFDEPFHLAYLQYLVQTGNVPLGHSMHVSEQIDFFLHNQPVSWGLRTNFPALLAHEDYWAQPNREKMDGLSSDLPFSGPYVEATSDVSSQYEAHQPPLYYLLTSPAFAVVLGLSSFLSAFLWMRLVSVVIASLVVPGSFFLARAILKHDTAAASVTAIVVLFPGLYPDLFRISNDALTVPLACWTFVFLVSFLEKRRPVHLYGLSAALIAGLWTKAFFIPILAAVFWPSFGLLKFEPPLPYCCLRHSVFRGISIISRIQVL